MLTCRAKKALGLIGRACGKHCARPWFFKERGRLYYPDGREIKGFGVHDLIDAGIFKPQNDGLLPGHSQTYVFDPSSGLQ